MQSHGLRYSFNDINAGDASQNESKTKIETAQYIADMILELRNLAKASEFDTLQGLLEISYYEAFSAANRIRIPKDEESFIHDLGSDARKATAAA